MVLQVFEVSNRIHLIHSAALLGVPLTRRPALVSTQYFNLKGQSQKMASAFVVFRNVSEVLVKQYSSLHGGNTNFAIFDGDRDGTA